MNRIHTALSAALLATSMVGTAALAQTTDQTTTNKADKTQVVPAREDLKPGAAPTVESMDANVQRQHDRNRDGSQQGSVAPASPDGAAPAAAGGTAAAGATRDWSAIDTDKDNLISPAEMEEALKATGPQAGQAR